MPFIDLTLANRGNVILVNVDKITAVTRKEDVTEIYLEGGDRIRLEVTEGVKDIMMKITNERDIDEWFEDIVARSKN